MKISGATVVAGNTLQLQLYNVKNPSSEIVTSSFNINLQRNSYYMEQLNTISTPLQFKAHRNIMAATLLLTNAEVGNIANYTFNIVLYDDISSSGNGAITIYFPAAYATSVTGSTHCVPACLSLSSTKAVFAATSFPSLSPTSLSVTIKINNITNPLTIGITTSFTINTLLYQSDSTSIVD